MSPLVGCTSKPKEMLLVKILDFFRAGLRGIRNKHLLPKVCTINFRVYTHSALVENILFKERKLCLKPQDTLKELKLMG